MRTTKILRQPFFGLTQICRFPQFVLHESCHTYSLSQTWIDYSVYSSVPENCFETAQVYQNCIALEIETKFAHPCLNWK